MKKLLFLLIIFSLNGKTTEVDGINSIQDGVKNFFSPLKKGPKYINEAISNIPELKNESRIFAEKEIGTISPNLEGQLSKIMIQDQQGKVISYKEIDSREKLNGSYVIKKYEIKFFGGKTKEIEFKFLKPTMDGSYQFVDAILID